MPSQRPIDLLEQAARAREQRRWSDASALFERADGLTPLGPDELQQMGIAAYMLGRDDDFRAAYERAHQLCTETGDPRRAAYFAIWIGLTLMFEGKVGPGTGWLGKAHRILQELGEPCREHGYALLPVFHKTLGSGDADGARRVAGDAVEIGVRFNDDELVAIARHLEGRACLLMGRVDEGLALLDEAMVTIMAGRISPVSTGLVYCSVIEACQGVYAYGRAREWTEALTGWLAEQPSTVAFTGTCLVHRAEIMKLNGAWSDALSEAERACARFDEQGQLSPQATAYYQQAEVFRMRGELGRAEQTYLRAGECGLDPQPGLALLRLAQGQADRALATIRRALAASSDPLSRTEKLSAAVEIAIAAGELQVAAQAADELEKIADRYESDALVAMAADARGAMALAESDFPTAVRELRTALDAWLRTQTPYAAARTRVLMARACHALDDHDGCDVALSAARKVFEQLGAAPELAGLDAGQRQVRASSAELSPRELEVLRLVAAGRTNKEIASELFLSVRTVDRHLSNIFTKLGVTSRAAATAHAYERGLV